MKCLFHCKMNHWTMDTITTHGLSIHMDTKLWFKLAAKEPYGLCTWGKQTSHTQTHSLLCHSSSWTEAQEQTQVRIYYNDKGCFMKRLYKKQCHNHNTRARKWMENINSVSQWFMWLPWSGSEMWICMQAFVTQLYFLIKWMYFLLIISTVSAANRLCCLGCLWLRFYA